MTTLTLNITYVGNATADQVPTPREVLENHQSFADELRKPELSDLVMANILEEHVNLTARDQLNATGTFKCPSYPAESVNDQGHTVRNVTYIVENMESVAGLTTENAFEMSNTIIPNEAVTCGIGDYIRWRNLYYSKYYTATFTATTA